MAKKLPGVDAFSAMLDRAFPDGPHSDTPSPVVVITPVVVTPVIIEDPLVESINIQTVSQTVEKADGCSDGCSDRQPDRQTVVQPVNQTVRRLFRRSVRRSPVQTVDQTVSQTVVQTVGQYKHPTADTIMFADPIKCLTRSQCLVLLFLIQQPGIAQRPAISEYTGVPFGTVKDALALLTKKGFISKPQYYVNGDYRGISYVTNRALCDDFLKKRGPEFNQTVSQTVVQTVGQTVVDSDGCSDGQTVAFSSKVLTDENLTTKEADIFEDPELKFWRGEGVTERQVKNWMSEFQLSREEIVLSLRYGRFDVLERGDVQNSANWFYKIVTKNGFYPKPANYRSLIEIKAEALQQQQTRDKEAKARLDAAEFETYFQTFLADPEAELYRELLSQVSAFSLEQLKEGEKMPTEIELRELLKNQKGTESSNVH